ncbi:MAG: diacylglycerol kinase family lipid kinase [Coriobacteriales bacterium]|jgi:YegS/Rv2252/BmrU family lipid kinase|nr:diacylglycerol kinase family lipid kinase [Coriobacteriales bacterium]
MSELNKQSELNELGELSAPNELSTPSELREHAANVIKTIAVLVNPVAGSGLGAKTLVQAQEQLPEVFPAAQIDIVESQSKEHVSEFATTTQADLLIVIGGDGTLHDAAQGLLTRPQKERPLVTLIAVGSGNDYARTLGISQNPQEAFAALAHAVPIRVDVGCCTSNASDTPTYYLETLSFGVDAAVGLNTHELRKTTRTKGLRLYARAAISAIFTELKPYHAVCKIDDETLEDDLLICAVQNGPTYGSGFKVAPQASITDGLLNICVAQRIGTLRALYYLTRIKAGTHETLPAVSTYVACRFDIKLDREVPIQCDGERLLGTQLSVELLPAALEVLVPKDSPVLTAPAQKSAEPISGQPAAEPAAEPAAIRPSAAKDKPHA